MPFSHIIEPMSEIVGKMLYGRSSTPFGLSWEQWAIKWWKWIFSIPEVNSPLEDLTGEKCSINQSGPIWFLAGTPGGSAERSCSIPAGKAVMFPIINVECNSVKDSNEEEELIRCVKSDVDTIRFFDATIDGILIPHLKQYRVRTPVFSVELPAENIQGVIAGSIRVISDGYYLLLKSMESGTHLIQFGGSCLAGTVHVGATWHITIE
jgi:hypothetical protein